MTSRLFISFDIPEDILQKIISVRNELYPDKKVSWEGRNKLHITAKFLGDTDENLIPEIENRIEKVISDFPEIKSEFNRFGIFYKNDKPKILWLGMKENETLQKLYACIEKEMYKLGFEKEKRKFKPHLTILRVRGREDISKIIYMSKTEIDSIVFYIEQVSLIKSELQQSGSVYTILKSFKLS